MHRKNENTDVYNKRYDMEISKELFDNAEDVINKNTLKEKLEGKDVKEGEFMSKTRFFT